MAEDPVERAEIYLAGFSGENDLTVGPHMLAWALEDLLRHHRENLPATPTPSDGASTRQEK